MPEVLMLEKLTPPKKPSNLPCGTSSDMPSARLLEKPGVSKGAMELYSSTTVS